VGDWEGKWSRERDYLFAFSSYITIMHIPIDKRSPRHGELGVVVVGMMWGGGLFGVEGVGEIERERFVSVLESYFP